KKTPISLRGEWLFLIGMLFFTNLAFQGLGMLEVLFYTKLFPEFMIKVFWNDGIEFDKANEIVLALVCAPLFEEIVFRGYLFGYLKRRYTIFIALFFSSLAFGFLHVAYPLSTVVFGMVACGLYMRY